MSIKKVLQQKRGGQRKYIFFGVLLLAGLVVAACNCPTCACPECTSCPDCSNCAELACAGGTGFEDLVIGTQYQVSDSFTSSGIAFQVLPFQWANGQWASDGNAEVVADQFGSSTKAMSLNNVNLGLILDYECIWIDYCELGGNVNFIANTVIQSADDFQDLAGFNFNGLSYGVYNITKPNCGRIETKGKPEKFDLLEKFTITLALGGQELYIDNICPCK
jgi:hypothetical protein